MDEDLLARLAPSYRWLSERRFDQWLELLAEDVEINQAAQMPGTRRRFSGREGARAMINEIDEFWEGVAWEPTEARELDSGRYLIRVRISGRGRGSGVPLVDELGHVMTVRDGLVTRLDIFIDWESAMREA